MSTVEVVVSVAIGSFSATCCVMLTYHLVQQRFLARAPPEPVIQVSPLTDSCIVNMLAQDESEDFGRSSNPKSSETNDGE